jgi:signal transduction histidine kinase
VITLYKAKKYEAGKKLHHGVRDQFFDTFSLCESYKTIHLKRITQARLESQHQAENLRIIALAAILAVFLFASSLAFFLINQILGPLRKLSMVAVREGGSNKPVNEIQALSHGVHDLIEDIGQTHSELERSREHLLQAEKMALVGKLAAGMAHSIRNPFTSVKMRLFSLERSLKMSEIQKDDLKVISEEIRHIDTIVQNFLEFSRPPKLKTQRISPSSIVDSAVQLLEHRLKSYDVGIQIIRSRPLPEILADPEQLKEVLVNLVVNACEAMENGGSIVIREEEVFGEPVNKRVVIRLSDNGPGILATTGYKIFQPFFTTKEEGTGLGLSIAARIIEEHQGRLDIDSEEGKGATFIITLPVKE